jgi:hypothetical protein
MNKSIYDWRAVTRVLGFALACGRSRNSALNVPRDVVLSESQEISATQLYSNICVIQGVAGG